MPCDNIASISYKHQITQCPLSSTSWAGGPSIPDYFGSVRRALYVVTALRATAGLTAGGFLAHKIIKAAYGNR